MGIVNTIREAGEDVAEATGTEKVVDKVEDEIQKRTGVDLGGSGGGPNDSDVDNTGSDDKGVSDQDGGTGGTKASGGSAFDNSSGDSPTTGGGSSGGSPGGSSGRSSSGGSTGGTQEATNKGKQALNTIKDTLKPEGSTKEKLQDARERIKNSELSQIQNEERLENELQMRRPFQPPQQRERTEAFIQNFQAEQKAEDQQEQLQKQISQLESGPSRQDVIQDLENRKDNLLEKSEENGKVYNLSPINRKLDELRSGKGIYTIQGEEGETQTVTKDQALTKLKDQKTELSSIVSEARENQKMLIDPPEPIQLSESARKQIRKSTNNDFKNDRNEGPDLLYSRAPGSQKKIAEKQDRLANTYLAPDQRQEIRNEIKDLKLRARTPAELPGGTDIPGQSYLSGPLPKKENSLPDPTKKKGGNPALQNAELEDFTPTARFVRSLQVLGTTSAGFKGLFGAPLDPDTTISEVVEEKSQEMAEPSSSVDGGLDFLGSPAGLLVTGGAGKVVGAGAKGVQLSAGSSRVVSALGTGAKVGGAGLVGYQAGKGARNIQQGNVATGVGQIAQVTAETGAFTKGLKSASQKYGKRLSWTTNVEQDNFLRQIQKADDDSFLVGSGEMTARTRVVQNNPFKPNEVAEENVVDVVESTADYRLVADGDGAEAQGTITDNLPNGDQVEKEFQSLSTVVAREGDEVITDGRRVALGEDEVATNNILRTEKNGRLFREFDDTNRFSVTRKEGEQPVSEIRSFNSQRINEPIEVEDAMGRKNVVGELQADVVNQIRRGNLDAKTVQLSSYTNDRQGEVFSETSNLILNKKSGGSGPGSFGSGGQGLQYRQDYGDGFIQETQRQARAGEQFGARSREVAEQQIESGSRLQGFSSGGSGSQGAQAGLGSEVQTRSGQDLQVSQNQQVGTPQTTGQNLRVSRTRAGERLKQDLGVSTSGGSGQLSRGNPQGLRRKQSGNLRNVNLNDIKTGLGQDQAPGQGLKLNQGRGLDNLNQLRQTGVPQVGQVSNARLGTLTIPGLRARTKVSTAPGLRTSTVTTPTTITGPTGGPGAFRLDLDVSGARGSTKGEGNIGLRGRLKEDINLDLLSANRSELLTGKKTFNTDQVSSFSQSPFSGGIKTQEEQNLGKRKFKSDKEVDFY